MRSPTRFFFITMVIGGLALVAGSSSPAAGEPAAGYGLGVGVDIVPDSERADAYLAQAVVTDLETKEVLSAPHVLFLRGPEGRGQIRSGTTGGLQVFIQVEVDEAGETATYEAEIRRGEALISVHKVRVKLAGGGAAK